ncbi:MAG TPA: thioredoxin [Xanthobacteraceae bacterium]|nr:thioredoxin [Xanthobacteraceae bacterium]
MAALSEIAASHRAEMAEFAPAGAGEVEESWPEPGESPAGASDPADVGFVHDAPPIATADSASFDDPLAGYDTRSDGPLTESPALAPIEHEPVADDPLPEDIETVAARRASEQARNRRFGWPLSVWPSAILAFILLDLGLIGWRADIVRVAPQTASLYAALGLPVNLRGIVLANVTTEAVTNEGVPVLLIQGQIVSTAKRTVEVPRLRFALRNASGIEIYSWTALPTRSLLSPGETVTFQSRLASPPPETRDVLVRFFNRHDLGIGIQ